MSKHLFASPRLRPLLLIVPALALIGAAASYRFFEQSRLAAANAGPDRASLITNSQIAALALAAVVVLAVAWLGSAVYANRRIIALAKTMQRLAAGDLRARAGLAYVPDAIGGLAQSVDQMARALERRETEYNQAAKLQAALYRIADITSRAEDMQEFYRALHKVVGELMYARNFYIALYDAASGCLTYPYFVDEVDAPPPATPLGKGLTDWVLRAGQPLWATGSVFADLLQRGEVDLIGSDSVDWLGVPLKRGGNTFGVLAVQSYSDLIHFCDRDCELLTFVSQHISTALERKQAAEAEREQRIFIEALSQSAAALVSTLSYDEVFDRILLEIGRVIPNDSSSVMLLEEDSVRLVAGTGYAQHGVPDTEMVGLRFPLSAMVHLRSMLATGRPAAISDTQADPQWLNVPSVGWIRSYTGAPIWVKGQVLGFVNIDSAQPGFYTTVQAERLQAFADLAGLAIESARLYDEARRHAAELEWRVAARTAELSEREVSLREAALALQTANQRLQELDYLKNAFISHVSHELRTPLANIKMYLSLLEHGKPEKQPHYLATLQIEADVLHRLIEQVLELSSLDLHKEKIVPQPVDVNQLVEAAAGNHQALLARSGLTLVSQAAPDLHPALGRPKLLMQVLTNLLSNALNYTPQGGTVTLRTRSVSEDGQEWIAIEIRDTGPGLSAEDRAHIFERFVRGESAHDSGRPGAGLGLAIASEILQRLDGRITVDSQPGQGSTFTIWLRPADAAGEEGERPAG